MAGKHEYHHARRPLDRMSTVETKQFPTSIGCVDWNELVAAMVGTSRGVKIANERQLEVVV